MIGQQTWLKAISTRSCHFHRRLGEYIQARKLRSQTARLANEFEFRIVEHYGRSSSELLARLCDQHGCDKGTNASPAAQNRRAHTYSDYYGRLFDHCRQSVTRVFECGVGTRNPAIPYNMGPQGQPGASLRVWRDYFPNATVIGADIDRDILFQEDRIKTFFVDQCDPSSIAELWAKVGLTDFDLMIDDGLHEFEAGSCLFQNSIARLAKNGIYVIEDVKLPDFDRYKDFFAEMDFSVSYINLYRPNMKLKDNSLIVVRRSC